MSVLLSLPDELVQMILKEWIDNPNYWCLLDSAISCHALRDYYLNILPLITCEWEGDFDTKDYNRFSWLRSKSINLLIIGYLEMTNIPSLSLGKNILSFCVDLAILVISECYRLQNGEWVTLFTPPPKLIELCIYDCNVNTESVLTIMRQQSKIASFKLRLQLCPNVDLYAILAAAREMNICCYSEKYIFELEDYC